MSLTQDLALGPGPAPSPAQGVDLAEAVWTTPLITPTATLPALLPIAPALSLKTQQSKKNETTRVITSSYYAVCFYNFLFFFPATFEILGSLFEI